MSNAALARIAGSQAAVGAQYPKFGRYVFEVQSIRTKDGFRGLSAIAELKVVKAEKTHEVEPSRVGNVVSYVENLTDAKKNGGGRFKAFLMALAGAEEHEMDLGKVATFCGDKQPGAFLQVACDVIPKELKAIDGKPAKVIEAYRWSTIEPTAEQIAQIEAQRKAASLPPLAEALA